MFFCIIEEESTQDNTQDNSYTGNVFMENSHNEPKYIEVRGACVHNLKNVNVNVPLHQIVGIAGVSGSGKSSLALGVLYAEGSRRYLESLSTYTRRRMTGAAGATERRASAETCERSFGRGYRPCEADRCVTDWNQCPFHGRDLCECTRRTPEDFCPGRGCEKPEIQGGRFFL